MDSTERGTDGILKSCDIRIDRDGVWYYRGAEMFRKDILRLFYENLVKDDEGRYLIEMGSEKCYLDVEDTPFIVRAVRRVKSDEREGECIILNIIDDSEEVLDPTTLQIGKDNVLYCSIRNGEHKARFSRPAYYELARSIEYDFERKRFYLSLNRKIYDIPGQTYTETEINGGASC